MTGKLKDHQLEKKLGDYARAVVVRRSLFESRIGRSMESLPVEVRARCVLHFRAHVKLCCVVVLSQNTKECSRTSLPFSRKFGGGESPYISGVV